MSRPFLGLICASLICSLPALADAVGKPATAEELIQSFASAKRFWKQREIARELVQLRDPAIIPRMERHLATQDRRRRCNAALVIAGLGDKRGIGILIAELEDTEPRPTTEIRSDGRPDLRGQVTSDRYYAALLLGQLGSKEAVPALIKATKDKTISYRAAVSLGQIGDARAIPALRKMAKRDPDNRLWAGYGLAALGEQEGFDILAHVTLGDPQWTERRHAAEALGSVGDRRALPVLLKALKDTHVNVRVSAVRSLARIGDPAALPALTEALNDKEATQVNAPTTVEAEARKAIAAIGQASE